MLVLAVIDDDTPIPAGVTVVAHVRATGNARGRQAVATDALGVHAVAMLLDYDETAGALGVSRRQVERLTKAGELPYVEIGGSRRIDPSDLRTYIAQHRHGNDQQEASR